MPNKTPTHPNTHTLAHLRSLVSRRNHALTYRDALRIAQRQAEQLHQLHGTFDGPIPNSIITDLPQLHIELVDSPISSLRFWDAGQQQWVIQLAASDAEPTRRFHLAYEFKHILDHNRRHQLYRGDEHHTTTCQAERTARHFAGLLLVPSVALADAWAAGTRDITTLATLFEVDATVITARLAQIGVGAEASIDSVPHSTRKECLSCSTRVTGTRGYRPPPGSRRITR